MSRYIDADELKKQDFQDYSPEDVEYAIDHCPTADMAEVRHSCFAKRRTLKNTRRSDHPS